MIYYRRYIGSYQKRTTRLSMRDHGAYALMLDFYYAEEQPLPLELDDIYDICKVRDAADRKSVEKVLRLHFEKRTDGYHNERADHELSVSGQARTNGKLGGRPRSGPITETITGNETGLETGSETGQLTGDETEPITGEGGGSVHPSTYNHLAVQPLSPSASQPSTDQPPQNRPRKRGHGSGNGEEKFEVPEWIPREQWDAWIEARKKKKKDPTKFACELAIAKLEELKDLGHHPAAVLAQSAFHGWTDLYPPKA